MLRLRAPAKLNLLLRVLGREAGGYHRIQTLFQLVDRCDELELEARAAPGLDYADDTGGALGADHLCARAYALLQARRPDRGAALRLAKRIPVGAGMGGGSSDAAAVLHGLNRLWGLGLPPAELAALGARLGADVPLFVHGRTAWGEGRGGELAPVDRPPGHAVVLPPPAPVSTAAAYRALELTRPAPPITMAQADAHWGENVFEDWLRRERPEIGRRLDFLRARAPAAVTGAGGAVFAWLGGRAAAERLLAQCPPAWGGFAAAGLARSPLLAAGG